MKTEFLKTKRWTQPIFISFSCALLIIPSAVFASTGYIDSTPKTVQEVPLNQALLCRDVTCTNPTPSVIDFNAKSDSPLVIDSILGLSGKVWGNDLGWITFNPPFGGVRFADPAKGILTGTAWSETSGEINFGVTGQQVVIDPKTGEWRGWAWASGPYGGWIKFDCNNPSACVRSTWRGGSGYENSQSSQTANASNAVGEISSAMGIKNIETKTFEEGPLAPLLNSTLKWTGECLNNTTSGMQILSGEFSRSFSYSWIYLSRFITHLLGSLGKMRVHTNKNAKPATSEAYRGISVITDGVATISSKLSLEAVILAENIRNTPKSVFLGADSAEINLSGVVSSFWNDFSGSVVAGANQLKNIVTGFDAPIPPKTISSSNT